VITCGVQNTCLPVFVLAALVFYARHEFTAEPVTAVLSGLVEQLWMRVQSKVWRVSSMSRLFREAD